MNKTVADVPLQCPARFGSQALTLNTHSTGQKNSLYKLICENEVESIVCPTNQYRVGANPGSCQACSNTACGTSEKQEGSCSGTTNGFTCTTIPNIVCDTGQRRVGANPGTCTDLTTPPPTVSSAPAKLAPYTCVERMHNSLGLASRVEA